MYAFTLQIAFTVIEWLGDKLIIFTKFIISWVTPKQHDASRHGRQKTFSLRCATSIPVSTLRNISSRNVLLAKGVTFKIWALQIYFPPFGSKDRSVSALSPIRGRILSNLSCLMKNSASWPPISAVSGCYVRYRGGGAGERRGNCFGLQHCMISIITAKDLIHPHIL